ncbi:isochorismate synthase [Halovivax limisalsi]|uniref:isochorismate synthase n=1 Tax=Halovivax limisalsi TaxID=1453760 RepID=UPI001FFC5E5A|nr:isochorismate synthase [Halovivax limisalsi]
MERRLGGRAAPSSPGGTPTPLRSYSTALSVDPGTVGLTEDHGPRVCWRAPDGPTVYGFGAVRTLQASGPDRFESLRAQARAAFDGLAHDGPEIARPRAIGGLAFHADPPDEATSTVWGDVPRGTFRIPRVQLVTDEETYLTVTGSDDAVESRLATWRERLESNESHPVDADSPTIVGRARSTDRSEWRSQIESALSDIASTRLEKLVLALSVTLDLDRPIRLGATLDALSKRYPSCYRFAVDAPDGATFFGAPPERLVAVTGRAVETEALAGSVPRGETESADEAFTRQLRTSEKLDAEHDHVVAAIRRQLAERATSVTTGDRRVKRLATIQHLRTPISATLAEERHVLDLVEALHPTPAVGGVPQSLALETIRSIESFDRGWYAAPVGWFDADGDGEFAVAIRSALARDERVTLFAGNGIVAGSDPAAEWNEVELKFRPIREALR